MYFPFITNTKKNSFFSYFSSRKFLSHFSFLCDKKNFSCTIFFSKENTLKKEKNRKSLQFFCSKKNIPVAFVELYIAKKKEKKRLKAPVVARKKN